MILSLTYFLEYDYCSDRGICDFTTGDCACLPGYVGAACDIKLDDAHYEVVSNSQNKMQINILTNSFLSSAIEVGVDKSPSLDFFFIEGYSSSDKQFHFRGDGETSCRELQIMSGGATISARGLHVRNGGLDRKSVV